MLCVLCVSRANNFPVYSKLQDSTILKVSYIFKTAEPHFSRNRHVRSRSVNVLTKRQQSSLVGYTFCYVSYSDWRFQYVDVIHYGQNLLLIKCLG